LLDILKHIVFSLLAFAFLSAPVAEAQHTIEEKLISCEIDHAKHHSNENEQEHHHHDHHVHSCGSCHIHLLEQDWVPQIKRTTPKQTHGLPNSEGPFELMPIQIDRPPKT